MTQDEWEKLLQPYVQTVDELKVKLRGMRQEFELQGIQTPVEFVTGRVKTIPAIEEKLIRRHISIDRIEQDMEDLAGVRIMTQFTEDIYRVVDLLRKRKDMVILEERDYVTNEKPSGYRSYHIVIEYPVQLVTGEKKVLAEIQVRTMQMNVWATIEHAINYKYDGEYTEEMQEKLKNAAELSIKVDELFSELHNGLSENETNGNL
ncbi:GTP pyrophosphokinase family protein [Weissella paramesenteroides]|jgi:putative GTP pyrophosphokinase|uniref:RelA/SpoT domain protein n=2 Tax=Weissella paramesenteroides TaxID=1249 RepID=C5RBB4_WEIPA|nr:GTP pyrophosphokinase family protein [Weissella paramesenteroides]ATF41037.1 GTP pyrophosphokinase [Weissella paramesenteroides]EER74471.1 RelA/SpoT domain protein [Weissella paramesenteroides ATCC 33313]KAA8440824.1 GTP pyrophosphokinase family protein [Weissella paramesenteroides]KAA8441784.1 GTP pyrophosphokinase family protein [Weissella paramesenteroides]KAA8443255.1 GTP pyrophosphokinase family protein [Weissella paramesenteroides]